MPRFGDDNPEARPRIEGRRCVDRGDARAKRARELSRLAIMALEGALILARVEASPAPILLTTDEMAALFERECGA